MERAKTLGATLVLGFSAISAAQVDPGNGNLGDCTFGQTTDGSPCWTFSCPFACGGGTITCIDSTKMGCCWLDETNTKLCKCVAQDDCTNDT